MKKDEKERIPKPNQPASAYRDRTTSPGQGQGKGKGKGKGKAEGGKTNPGDRGRSPTRKSNLYCGRFLKTGKCHLGDQCPDSHFGADKVNALKGIFGDNLEGYFKAGQ